MFLTCSPNLSLGSILFSGRFHFENDHTLQAACAKKILQQLPGFVSFHAGDGLDFVVEAALAGDVEDAAGTATLRVGHTEDDAFYSGEDDGAGTHGAGFFGDVEGGAFETPVTEGVGGLGDGEYLGVGGGVFEEFDLVEGARDNFLFPDDDGTDRNFVGVERQPSLAERFAHEVGVAGEVDHRREARVCGANWQDLWYCLRVKRWLPVILIAVGVLVYANSLTGPFIFDDGHGITENPSIRQLWPVWDALVAPATSGMAGRPVVNLSFALNYAVGEYEVFGYHVVNLAIHLLAGVTLLGVLRRAKVGDGVAFVATSLWLVHPVLTESVDYVSQRTELLMGLFFLLTFYCFLRSLASARVGLWQLATVIACGIGMGCKEVMATAPVLVFAYDYVFVTGDWRRSWRERRRLYLALAATLGMLPLLIGGVALWAKLGKTAETLTPWEYAQVQCTILVRYLRLCFWPTDLLLDYKAWPRVHSVREIIPQGVLIVGLVGAALWGTVRRYWWGFLGLWFFVILAPTSSFIPLALEVGAERRLYLSSIAVVLLVVVTVNRFLKTRSQQMAGLVAAVGVAGLFGALTWRRNQDYSSAINIWTDTVAKAPHNHRAQNNLANRLDVAGRSAEAEVHYRLALAEEPGDWRAWFNYAGLLVQTGRLDEAVAAYRRAVALNPLDLKTLINLGATLGKLGQYPAAVESLAMAVRLEPLSVPARYNLGFALMKSQRYADAVPQYRAALELQPHAPAILFGLGNALTQAGQTNDARRYLTEAAQRDPQSASIRHALEALGP